VNEHVDENNAEELVQLVDVEKTLKIDHVEKNDAVKNGAQEVVWMVDFWEEGLFVEDFEIEE
jgi:hypothetical protein